MTIAEYSNYLKILLNKVKQANAKAILELNLAKT